MAHSPYDQDSITPEGWGEYKIADEISQEVPSLSGIEAQQVDISVNVNKGGRFSKIKNVGRIVAAGLVLYGGYQFVNGLFSEGGSTFKGEAEIEETRVFVYNNTPLELANIQSDIDLELTAGYDRTGPIPGVDINPVNNEYTFNQNDLTTETNSILTVESMRVEDKPKEVLVTLDGDFELGNTSIDWNEEEFAGADIKGTSLSFGNEKKDEIDNDALEILQGSGRVAAACAVKSDEVQPLLTNGVEEFLSIVNPALVSEEKPLKVVINNIESGADTVYADAVDGLNDTVREIKKDYSGDNDVFDLDISGILDCDRQKIRVAEESN